jgi:hypothetical protein
MYQIKSVTVDTKTVIYLEIESFPGVWFTLDNMEFLEIDDDPESFNCAFNVIFEDESKEIDTEEFKEEVRILVNDILRNLEQRLQQAKHNQA